MNSGEWSVGSEVSGVELKPSRAETPLLRHSGESRNPEGRGFLSVEGAAVGCRAGRSRTLSLALPQRGRGFVLYWECQARRVGVRFDTVRVFYKFGNQGKGVSTLHLLPSYPLPLWGRGFALYWERQARQVGVRFDTVRVFDKFGNQGKGVSTLPLLPSYPLPLWGRVRERVPHPDDST